MYRSVTNFIFIFKRVDKRKGNHNPIERKRERERKKRTVKDKENNKTSKKKTA
jgi:hypothetical protein